MRFLAGCCGVAGALLAVCALFVARVRLYDSLGEYKGVGNIGTGPLYLLAFAVCLLVLAWALWRKCER